MALISATSVLDRFSTVVQLVAKTTVTELSLVRRSGGFRIRAQYIEQTVLIIKLSNGPTLVI